MGALMSMVATGLTFCCCTASMSLCTSCLGNDKPSSEPPSATSGRRRSVFLLIVALGLAFAFQYGVAPALQPDSTALNVPKVGKYLIESWTDGCAQYETAELQEKCSGNNGVYRVAASAFLFFILAAMAAACKPTANREAWPAKYILFLFLVAATVFIPNSPLFSPIFLNVGRIGAVIFIFFQQIILIDLAYNLNESWVEKSNKADQDEGDGAGKKWLGAILAMCAFLFLGSLVVIGLMFHYFSGCATNMAFISVTLVLSIAITAAQLSGEEASLLTSGVIVAYATYLCFTAVSKNPNGECNPKLGEEDILGICLGIGFTLLSLSWTGWSFTAASKVGEGGGTKSQENSLVENEHPSRDADDGDSKKVTGVVINQDYGTRGDEESGRAASGENEASASVNAGKSWKLNIVLALVSCWFAMALTGWGAIEQGGNAANPDVGNISMWMIIASQWTALLLYLWTLLAPRLFPDRDFS